MKKLLGGIVLLLVVGAVLFVVLQQPSNDREWKPYLSRLTDVEIEGDTVTFTNVRDWTYSEEGPLTTEYVHRSYNVSSLTGMQFVVEPFPANEALGHTLLTFEFSDAPPISFSVEARIEEGEDYSGIRGLFNTYELSYTWGTERDFLSRRAVMLGHDVYVYDIHVSPDVAQDVFVAFADGTKKLNEKPVFYNTVMHNCTNELAHLINEKTPGAIPWDWSRLLTGKADEYLYKLGYIEGESWEAVTEKANKTELIRLLATSDQFSGELRESN